MRAVTIMVLGVALLLAAPAVSGIIGRADDSKYALIKFSPAGRPEKMDHPGAHIYLWRTLDGFHIKTTGKNGGHSTLAGEIRIDSGKFVNVRNLEKLEGGKKRGNADVGWISPEKKVIRFKFVTGSFQDGFDFDVEGDNVDVKFDLTVDGTGEPHHIHIGKEGHKPPATKFLIHAHGGRDKSKKKD